MFRFTGLAVLLATVFSCLSSPAHASIWNHVHVFKANEVVGCCWYVQEGAFPVVSEGNHLGHQLGWYSYNAAANAGIVESWILNHVDGNTQLNTARQTNAYSSIDDLVFTDGTGVPKPVTFYIKLHVEGESTADPGDPEHQGCFVSSLRLTSNQSYLGQYIHSWDASCGTAGGFLAGETGSIFSNNYLLGPFTTTSEQSTPVSLAIDMYVGASVAWAVPGYSEVTGRLQAHFVVGEPAILSEGFSANSVEAGIVDGYYQQVLAADSGENASGLRLSQSWPNPSREDCHIRFELQQSGPIALTIYDVSGRTIRRLADRTFEAGSHVLRWNGQDDRGVPSPPGVYLYRLRQGDVVATRSMIFLGR